MKPMSGERKPRVAGAKAKEVLIEATISLLEEIPVTELSTRKIQERSNLDRRAITRQFGSELELFVATLEELNRRALKQSGSLPPLSNPTSNTALKMRTDLLAFLILSGVDLDRLKAMQPPPEIVQGVIDQFGFDDSAPPEIRDALLLLVQALSLSATFFGPTSALNTPENAFVIFKMVQYLSSIAPELPRLLELSEK